MPCDSSHLEADRLEIEGSKVQSVLDEFRTGKYKEWGGYHPKIYLKINRKMMNRLTQKACTLCKQAGPTTIKKMSLETQIWWRDHQKADKLKQHL